MSTTTTDHTTLLRDLIAQRQHLMHATVIIGTAAQALDADDDMADVQASLEFARSLVDRVCCELMDAENASGVSP